MSDIIIINKPYKKAIKESKAHVEPITRMNYFGIPQQIGSIIIPPLNTDISIPTGYLKSRKIPRFELRAEMELPLIWNWRDNFQIDTVERREIKKIITKPQSQGLCGSCWAMCCANAISDLFAIKKGINPNLSATYCLSCFKQMQCGGGRPLELLLAINENGIASNRCIDYSWCDNSNKCSSSLYNPPQLTEEELNELIPKCGCYFPSDPTKHYSFYVTSPVIIDIDAYPNAVQRIKEHIYKVGPVIGGFNTFSNFTGNFEKTKGVYIDSYDYTGIDDIEWSGGHAVVIMGWGVEKNIPGYDEVPYWLCRNTWGVSWGDGGYFKMAMYPINKKTALEKIIDIKTPEETVRSGGIYLFEVSYTTSNKVFKKVEYTGQKNNPDDWYKKDLTDPKEVEEETKKLLEMRNKEKYISKLVIGFICAWIIVNWILSKLHEVKKKKS